MSDLNKARQIIEAARTRQYAQEEANGPIPLPPEHIAAPRAYAATPMRFGQPITEDADVREYARGRYNPSQPRAKNGQWTAEKLEGASAEHARIAKSIRSSGGPAHLADAHEALSHGFAKLKDGDAAGAHGHLKAAMAHLESKAAPSRPEHAVSYDHGHDGHGHLAQALAQAAHASGTQAQGAPSVKDAAKTHFKEANKDWMAAEDKEGEFQEPDSGPTEKSKFGYQAKALRNAHRALTYAADHLKKGLNSGADEWLNGAAEQLGKLKTRMKDAGHETVHDVLKDLHASAKTRLGALRDLHSRATKKYGAEGEDVREYAFNAGQKRDEGGRWTADGGAALQGTTAADHHAARDAADPHSGAWQVHNALALAKDHLAEGNVKHAGNFLHGAAHAAAFGKDVTPEERDAVIGHVQQLATEHGLHDLGEQVGKVEGHYVPGRLEHAQNPSGKYSAEVQDKVEAIAGLRAEATEGTHKAAYKAIEEAAGHLAAGRRAADAGDKAKAGEHREKAHSIIQEHLTDEEGDYRRDMSPHALALTGHLSESVGSLRYL